MSCPPKGLTSLVDFQKNVLDISGARMVANNPVISYITNSPPSSNQMWQFKFNVTTGLYTIGNGVGGGNTTFLSYPAATGPGMLTTSDQAAVQPSSQALQFIVACSPINKAVCVKQLAIHTCASGQMISSVFGIWDAVFENALTSWALQSGSLSTPVTYEAYTGMPGQFWTFLD
ncbi:hypothetical protein DFH09DRAFT_1097616 [Mycena vulgaris]|nr:hypothetical protein DFH09DRAFT_1097616 [Mycena vulgaris]